ncbi:DUF262 domain-containing protein [Methanolobus sp. WCC5]|uniref:DUF262 domain-containing protein n=1 Tax=Methanolobus sp. WCC5 TaxID=3125785 RepID=UPI0032554AA6
MDISPDKQNIDQLFSNTTYYIDFYQRDYKWTKEPVERLLDDIFYRFIQEYQNHKSLDPTKEAISANYPWYYLNTYVTNTVEGKVYVVDGQQRLTTLTLILMKLYNLSKKYESKTDKWLESKIAGWAGMEYSFWMNHEKHEPILKDLFEGQKDFKEMDVSSGITAVNMLDNYQIISRLLDEQLSDKHEFETFAMYFLYRLVLINLSVEQTNVPMIFEVINDRGVRLKPYEILKGKLLGQIDKIEMDRKDYNGLWEKQVQAINDFKEDEIDTFFRYFLKSKFSNAQSEGKYFDGDYHREMFSNDVNNNLKLKHNPSEVKRFLEQTFTYYTQLYVKIWKAYSHYDSSYEHVFFNRLNEMDGQFLLILSSCKLNDVEEDEKIEKIAYELDRFFSLLQLQNAYESNIFSQTLYKISSEIRDEPIAKIREVFDKYLLEQLSNRRNSEASQPVQYAFFKNTGINLNMRFKRYFFARIEKLLAENTKLNMKHQFEDLVTKTGPKTGFHIEHILSRNEENLKLFNDDDDVFEQERNRLGGILLLKGKDNISSSNEPYSDKLKSYDNTLYWNETLREDFYKSKLDMRDFKAKFALDELVPFTDKFGPEELESRQKLLFKMIRIIWN